MSECTICVRTYNSTRRSPIGCVSCNEKACETCIRTYLLGESDGIPKCMFCNEVWTQEFLALHTPNAFHNKKFRDHKAQILMEKEKSLLPSTQMILHQEKEYENEIGDLNSHMDDLHEQIHILNMKKEEIIEKRLALRGKTSKTSIIVPKFCINCPGEECKGFIFKDKCDICGTVICKKCHIVLKTGKEEESEERVKHECKEDDIATVKFIKGSSKNCPSCKVLIYKISGCHVMFCCKCFTSFHWKTLKIITREGARHNPHYWEWFRSGGREVPRVEGDIVCGGLVTPNQLVPFTNSLSPFDNNTSIKLGKFLMMVNHVQDITILQYPVIESMGDNLELRIKYIQNKLPEKKFVSNIKKIQKSMEKNMEINQILQTFVMAGIDIYQKLMNRVQEFKTVCRYGYDSYVINPTKQTIVAEQSRETLTELTALSTHINEALLKVGNRLKNKIPYIDTTRFVVNTR